MTEPVIPPRVRSPYASAGAMVVSAIVVLLLVVFAYSRITRPEAPVVAAEGPAKPGTAAKPTPPGKGAPVADASFTGRSHPDDVIMARQLLMDGNETAMGPIDRAAGGEDIPLAALKDQAYAIYTNLSAAPHLFPPETKPAVSPDGSPPATAATATVWEDFDGFYDQAMAAASTAYDASQASDIGKFRTLAMQIRMHCDSCHAKYMHVFDPTTGK
jgi:cytochrome c556